MTAARQRLANRRPAESFEIECGGQAFTATVGYFPSGELAELFLSNGKVGSDADTAARDSAVVASIALQHGVPLDTIRRALCRDVHGRATGPLGAALDVVADGWGRR
jgi:ribonucleoside-diphosphate reductase alpha chain